MGADVSLRFLDPRTVIGTTVRGREGQPAHGNIIQAAIGDRAAPRHGYGGSEYLA